MQLSPTMIDALEMALSGNNRLYRHPGGYWTQHRSRFRYTDPSHASGTIDAVVIRGCMRYTLHKEGRNGKFPIEAQITDAGRAAVAKKFAKIVGAEK
jgi:hypothetical protein